MLFLLAACGYKKIGLRNMTFPLGRFLRFKAAKIRLLGLAKK
jgi:hypothetical protein